jgi:hypothetical protein
VARRASPVGGPAGAAAQAVRGATTPVPDGAEVARGYEPESFADAFSRYLPGEPANSLQVNADAGLADGGSEDRSGGVTALENGAKPHGDCVVMSVTAQRPGAGGGEGRSGGNGADGADADDEKEVFDL